MTRLTGMATVTREVAAAARRRPLIVELSAHYITLREKGTRDRVPVPLLAVYDLGLKLRAREAMVQRLKAQKARP